MTYFLGEQSLSFLINIENQ